MSAKKIVIGSLQIAGGNGLIQGLSFLRNFTIARVIGPEQFGIGLTFLLLVALVEMAADLSWDKFIVQDKDGDKPEVQSTLHLFLIVRGLIFAVALFVAADLITDVFATPGSIAWAYQVLAIVPVCVGFYHLDAKRFHRRFHYAPDILAQVSGNVASLAVGVAVAFWLGDYRAILVAVLARYAVMALMTHILAERPFHVGFSLPVARRAWRFGWPLMINGLVLFAGGQGDRALIANVFSPAMLGVYGASALVTQGLATLVGKVLDVVGLSLLAANRDSPSNFQSAYGRFGAVVTLVSVVLTVCFSFALPKLVPALYGAKFPIPDMLITLLVAGLGFLLFRCWATAAGLAMGASRLIMTSNILRASGLLIAIGAVSMGGGLIHVAGALVVGELVATVAIFSQLHLEQDISIRRAAAYFSILSFSVASCVSVAWLWPDLDLIVSLGFHATILAVSLIVLYAASPDTRELISHCRTVFRVQGARGTP